MKQIVMTDEAMTKVNELVRNVNFKSSLEKFARISSKLLNSESKLFPSKNKIIKNRMIKKIHNIDDLYMFRDRTNRFIFTVEEDENNNTTIILLDVVDRKEALEELSNMKNKEVLKRY